MEIDKYMIHKAEEQSKGEQQKTKTINECFASENSWKLSENFERNCKQNARIEEEEDIQFSM